MNHQIDMTSGPRVEVSGWDAREDFFVEKTYFNSESEEEITLKTSLREGCVLFLRVLEPLSTGSNFPIPYQAVHVKGRNAEGRVHVGLERLHPGTSRGRAELVVSKTTVKVA